MAKFLKSVRTRLSVTDIHLRLARKDDLERIIHVCARSFPGSLRWLVDTEPPRRWWRTALDSDSSEEWVAEERETGAIVGVMILVLNEHHWRTLDPARRLSPVEQISVILRAPTRLRARWGNAWQPAAPALTELCQAKRYDPEDRIFLELIATLPEAQGCGVGKRMLGVAFQRARELNRSAVACIVDPANPAVHLYQKLGFGITGQCEHGLKLSASVVAVREEG